MMLLVNTRNRRPILRRTESGTYQDGHVRSAGVAYLIRRRRHRDLLDIIVCPVSSQPRYQTRPGPGDHRIEHRKAVGLKHPSTVRISNILAVEKKLIKRVLGTLHADDYARVEDGLRAAFGIS